MGSGVVVDSGVVLVVGLEVVGSGVVVGSTAVLLVVVTGHPFGSAAAGSGIVVEHVEEPVPE